MLDCVETKARRAARAGALGGAAGLCATVGIAFLTVAGWIVLKASLGAATAALVLGVTYLGAAAILAAIVMWPPPQTAARPSSRPPVPPLAEAFAVGFGAGLKTGRR